MEEVGAHSGCTTVGIVGASARAALHSLRRAGLNGWAVDLFGDRDLKQLAPCATCPIEIFPNALPSLIANFPPGPILYTGGLENYPKVVSQFAASRILWGNLPDVLDRVRDPFYVASIQTEGIQFPKLIPSGEGVPKTGRWLRKPLRSSGGHGIRFAVANEAASSNHYFQQFIAGPALSAVFVGTGSEAYAREQTQLLGISEQLIGQPWLHAQPFAYCGNIGPIPLPQAVESAIWRFGLTLSAASGLRGLWGLDFIRNGDVAYPVEINPRYTASIEVLELSARFRIFSLHRDCFTATKTSAKVQQPNSYTATIGKAIYYAPRRMVFPNCGPWDDDLAAVFDPWRVPGFADIPEPQTVIEAGSPVLTFFAIGSSATDCRKGLQSRAAELDRLFAETKQ